MHDLGQSVSGNKRTLFNRLRDCQNATKVDDDTFEYQKQMVVGEDGVTRPAVPRWVILTPEDVPDVEGVNMATGAEEGFFAPTNKENSVGGKRANFLTAENFSRPEFGPRKKGSKRTVDDEMAPPLRFVMTATHRKHAATGFLRSFPRHEPRTTLTRS